MEETSKGDALLVTTRAHSKCQNWEQDDEEQSKLKFGVHLKPRCWISGDATVQGGWREAMCSKAHEHETSVTFTAIDTNLQSVQGASH